MGRPAHSNPYAYVPHYGAKFLEDSTQYYWNFTSLSVGTRYRDMLRVPGSYYRIPVDVTAVEERQTPVGRIVKWRNNLPFSPEQVQAATYKEGRDVIGDYMSAAEIADLT